MTVPDDVFRDQPVLVGRAVRLEPLTEAVLPDYLRGLADPEVRRLTGTRAEFSPAAVEEWLRTRRDQHDRADWAIRRSDDGAFLGEAVLNELEPEDGSAGFRIWLAGEAVFGRGYGTEATRLVVDFALDVAGLHRVALEVIDHNPRGRRVYEKAGFVLEGRLRDAFAWAGERHDVLTMALLSTDPRPWRTG